MTWARYDLSQTKRYHFFNDFLPSSICIVPNALVTGIQSGCTEVLFINILQGSWSHSYNLIPSFCILCLFMCGFEGWLLLFHGAFGHESSDHGIIRVKN